MSYCGKDHEGCKQIEGENAMSSKSNEQKINKLLIEKKLNSLLNYIFDNYPELVTKWVKDTAKIEDASLVDKWWD